MYLACADEVIDKKKKEVKKANQTLIDYYNKMSLWKRWEYEDKLNSKITDNWKKFEIWMNKRMREQKIYDP